MSPPVKASKPTPLLFDVVDEEGEADAVELPAAISVEVVEDHLDEPSSSSAGSLTPTGARPDRGQVKE